MTSRGRHSPVPAPPRPSQHTTQIRVIGPAHAVEAVKSLLAMADDSLPGFKVLKVSRDQSAERAGHVRIYIDVRVEKADG
ncbi:hypothetical protein [Nonomuraea typhae]|uniref:hypothetical protein n=1 Tax=Nonomuraea typhae TaxID=2603600 RepID=UPI0012FAE272|nr:hypothetical protein [Nonomuraea typhae]